MSDTPRTDANLGKHLTRTGFPVVDPVFARQLERELNAANERIKQLEEAGDGLQKASFVFLLSFVGDDYYADEGTPIRQVDPDASVQWEDPPTAGDHVQLQNAIDKWNQAVAAARAVLARAKEAKP